MNRDKHWTPEKWQQTIDALLRRAATDMAFRQKCLAEPREAIREMGGLELPASISVEFAEPKKVIVITLPPLRANGSAELTDAQLEDAVGGAAALAAFTTFVPPAHWLQTGTRLQE